MNKHKQRGESFFVFLLILMFLIVIAGIISAIAKTNAYTSIKPDDVWEDRVSNPFSRETVLILEKKEYWIRFKNNDGVIETIDYNTFYKKYKQK